MIVSRRLLDANSEAWNRISRDFIGKGASVDSDFNAFERMFRRVSHESISNGVWLLLGIGNRRFSATYNMLKKCMDFGLALVMLPVFLPLGCLIWLLIKGVDHEKPLFRQKRVGYMGKSFYIYKFRTIRQKNQESAEEAFTKTGKFLRRFRLDEIPQLINVLRGELSFVGPRPLWEGELTILNENIPNHTIRNIVKPGITGWAQLNFKAPPNYKIKDDQHPANEKLAFDAAFTRFSYDVWYIKNRSLWLDIEIMIKTGIRAFIKDSYVG